LFDLDSREREEIPVNEDLPGLIVEQALLLLLIFPVAKQLLKASVHLSRDFFFCCPPDLINHGQQLVNCFVQLRRNIKLHAAFYGFLKLGTPGFHRILGRALQRPLHYGNKLIYRGHPLGYGEFLLCDC
jgi:hypothetical protein